MKTWIVPVLLECFVLQRSGPGGAPPRLAASDGEEYVLDKGDPETTFSGNWAVSGGAEPYGADSVYSKQFGASAAYEFRIPEPAEYAVYLWWTEWSSRLGDVPVEIEHDGGTDIVYIDQRLAGGQWNPLGTWSFDGMARVTIHSVGPGSTCADAVKIVRILPPVGPPPIEIVVDNGEPGTSFTGRWYESGGTNPYGANSLYTKDAAVVDGMWGSWSKGSYTFEVPVPHDGQYEVALWWTEWPSRRSDVVVWLEHAVGANTYWIDQRSGGGRWNVIARWHFRGMARITIVSPGDGTTCADAVKLTEVNESSEPSELVIDNRDDACTFTGAWGISGGPEPYGTDSLYSKQAGASSTFHFRVPAPGWYELYLWWTEWPSRLGSVPVEFFGDYELRSTRYVDQRVQGGQWVFVTAIEIAEVGEVTIHSLGGGTTCVDALRVVLSTE